jgi:Zn-dependent protease with chaperone function
MPHDAIRQAILLLAFAVATVAMFITWIRGGDLLHVAFTGLWMLPAAVLIIFQVFRLWFLVLRESIRQKQQQDENEQTARMQETGE